MLFYYEADAGSLLLMHENGAQIHLENHYGDGLFKYYIFNSYDELKAHVNGRYEITRFPVYLHQKGWKVMDYDCAKSYNSEGTVLDGDYIAIYNVDATFFFVVDKTE